MIGMVVRIVVMEVMLPDCKLPTSCVTLLLRLHSGNGDDTTISERKLAVMMIILGITEVVVEVTILIMAMTLLLFS